MSGKSKSAAPKGRGSSRPSDQILRNNSSQHQHNALSDGQEQDEEEDAEDRTPTARKSAIHAPSSAPEASLAMQTPTQASREMLAGLDLSGEPQATPGGGMSDAIDKRVSELAASGWRPEEELAGIVGEDDDDDAYAGVDLISLSDEDDDAIRKQESRSFRQPSVPFGEQDSFARKLSISDAGSDNGEWHGFDDLDLTQGSEGFLDFDETRPASFLLADDESSFPRDRFTYDHNRKVRFQDELDGSDGESSDDDGAEAFPDIFLDTPQFTPSFQLMNDDDIYIDDGSDAGSVWDFDGEGHESQVQDDDEEDEEEWSESDGASSGYDSDDGETTDEEEPRVPVKKIAMVEADSSASPTASEDATPKVSHSHSKIPATPATKKKVLGKPKMAKASPDATPRMPKAGTFDMDPRRNVLLVDGAGASQRNTLFPARIQTPEERKYWQKMRQAYKNRTSTPSTSVQMSPQDYSDDFESASSFFDPGSPFDAFGTLLSGQVIGPAEAFLPFTSVDATGMITEDTSMGSGSDEEEDDDMDLLSPFVNFGGDYDDDDEDEDESGDTSDFDGSVARSRSNTLGSIHSPVAVTPSPMTPSLSRKNSASSPFGHDLFSHLTRSKGLVHSFRMNQHYAKHMASYAADPTVRYSTSEMNAMQTGRRKAANTPITPMRKRRGNSVSKVGKVDWAKGLGKMGPPATTPRRPGSSGSGIANGKKTPIRGHVFA